MSCLTTIMRRYYLDFYIKYQTIVVYTSFFKIFLYIIFIDISVYIYMN
jgi:hypothetical protein